MSEAETRVLIVDDDDLSLKLTEKIIAGRGHQTLIARSGREALELAGDNAPIDLLVLDLMMPEMNGFETLEELRARGLASMPVVMLTAKAEDESIIKGYQAGADYYLTKPFKPTNLLNIVDFLIGDLSDRERRRLEMLI